MPTQEQEQTAARVAQEKEREDFRIRLNREAAIEKVFTEFPSKFKVGQAEVLRSLPKIRFVDGEPFAGEMPLAQVLAQYVEVNGHAVAQSISEQHDKGASTVKAKSDLKTPKEKSDFIRENSLASFERLPLNRPQVVADDELTWSQYRALPIGERSRIAGEKGDRWIADLQRRSMELNRADALAGIPAEKRRR